MRRILALGLLSLVAACGEGAPAGPLAWTPDERALIASLSPLKPPPPSPGNRFADVPAAATLGQALFFDQRLSETGDVSCATCHQPSLYFTDGLPLAKGKGTTARHAPTVLGASHLPFVFWDGRKDSLWSQAGGPIESEVEHAFSRTGVAHVVATHHRARYEAIFGPLPPTEAVAAWPREARPVPSMSTSAADRAWRALPAEDRATIDRIYANVGKAIEAYERKLQPQPAPFDRFAEALAKAPDGVVPADAALSPAAQRGLRAFLGAGGCVNCHNGPLLTDKGFHNLGLPAVPGQSGMDVGRTLGAQQVKGDPFSCGGVVSDDRDCAELRFLNPRFEDFLGAFKTPTLRNVAKTGPYMHDGRFTTLEEVVRFYKERPGKAQIGHRDLVLDTMDVDAVDVGDLVAFLQTLTGPLPPTELLHPPAPSAATETP